MDGVDSALRYLSVADAVLAFEAASKTWVKPRCPTRQELCLKNGRIIFDTLFDQTIDLSWPDTMKLYESMVENGAWMEPTEALDVAMAVVTTCRARAWLPGLTDIRYFDTPLGLRILGDIDSVALQTAVLERLPGASRRTSMALYELLGFILWNATTLPVDKTDTQIQRLADPLSAAGLHGDTIAIATALDYRRTVSSLVLTRGVDAFAPIPITRNGQLGPHGDSSTTEVACYRRRPSTFLLLDAQPSFM